MLQVTIMTPRNLRLLPVFGNFVHPWVHLVNFEAVTPVTIQFVALWEMTLFCLIDVYRRLRETCFRHKDEE